MYGYIPSCNRNIKVNRSYTVSGSNPLAFHLHTPWDDFTSVKNVFYFCVSNTEQYSQTISILLALALSLGRGPFRDPKN